jgi:hypothetical protein
VSHPKEKLNLFVVMGSMHGVLSKGNYLFCVANRDLYVLSLISRRILILMFKIKFDIRF